MKKLYRLQWDELTDSIRLFGVWDENTKDKIYIMLWEGELVFLREINEVNNFIPQVLEKSELS